MRTASALRIGAHVGLYFGIVAQSRLFLGALYLPFAVYAAIIISALFAVSIESRPLRILCAASPALLLILSNSIFSAIALALPIAYSVILIGSDRFTSELWQLKNEATLILLFSMPIMMISLLGGYGELFGEEYPRAPIHCSWVFLFCAVMLVFLMLRAARTGCIRSASWQTKNVLTFLIPLAAAIPLGILLKVGLIPVMKFVAIVICAPFIALIYFGNIAFSALFAFGKDFESTNTIVDPEVDFETLVNENGTANDAMEYFMKATHIEVSRETMLLIGAIILGILLIVAVVFILRRGISVRKQYVNEGYYEADEEYSSRRRHRRGIKTVRDSAERVRYTYRQYLAFLKIHGIVPSQSKTTGDISEAARSLLNETDELLRELYRKARYGPKEEVTEQEAELAAEVYLRLVNDDNIKKAIET